MGVAIRGRHIVNSEGDQIGEIDVDEPGTGKPFIMLEEANLFPAELRAIALLVDTWFKIESEKQ